MVLMLIFFVSCGGGGGDEGPHDSGVTNLQGMWFGLIEDDTGALEEFSLRIDSTGNVVDVQISGISTGDTGWINEDWDANLYHVLFNDNPSSPLSRGILIVDNQKSHAIYGDYGTFGISNYYYGVLEKESANLPAYAISDLVGNYPDCSAYEFTLDPATNIWNWEGDAIAMIINQDLTFTGDAPEGSFSGSFYPFLYKQDYGQYIGSLVRNLNPPITMDIEVIVCPDKTFVGAFAKEINTNPTALEDFLLIGLKK